MMKTSLPGQTGGDADALGVGLEQCPGYRQGDASPQLVNTGLVSEVARVR